MPKSGFPPPVGPRASVRAPVAHRPAITRHYRGKQSRTPWYVALGALALLAAAAALIIVSSDDQTVDDAAVDISASTVRVASEPPVLPTTSQASTTAVVAASTAPPTVPGTVPGAVPPTVAPTVASTVLLPTTAPAAMVDVADATGSFVVQLPVDFQTTGDPVVLNGIDMNNVSGATDITRYLGGDFSVVGATVLAGPTAQVGTAGSVLAQFDPQDACTLSDFETDVTTSKGQAVVLSYDDCGGGLYSMVLVGVEVADLQQTVFISVQDVEPSLGGARTFALGILESFHPAP